MWKAVGVSLALLVAILVISKMQGGQAGLDPRDQLAFERQRAERRHSLLEARAVPPPALACAAGRTSQATVQTLYLVWINHRSDLTTVADRDDAANDVSRSITGCGGDPALAEDAAHRQGIDLGQAAAQAMLQAGR